MEIIHEGALSTIKKSIRALHPTKKIREDLKRCGGRRVILVCRDCDSFHVKISRRGEASWLITEATYDHGRKAADGSIEPCVGTRKLSTRDLLEDKEFQDLMNAHVATDGGSKSLSSETICRILAEKRPLALEVSVDVVKKARAAHLKAIRSQRAQGNVDAVELPESLEN